MLWEDNITYKLVKRTHWLFDKSLNVYKGTIYHIFTPQDSIFQVQCLSPAWKQQLYWATRGQYGAIYRSISSIKVPHHASILKSSMTPQTVQRPYKQVKYLMIHDALDENGDF